MFLSPPAHLIGTKGSAYRYGQTVVGGTRNLWGDGQTMYPMIPTPFSSGFLSTAISLLLGGTGAGAVDQILEGAFGVPFPQAVIFGPGAFLANGEGAYLTTLQTGTPRYGAILESITAAGTVAVTASGTGVIGTGTAFTTTTLSTAYAYTPNENLLRVGDLIHIVQGSSEYWHRIVAITDATHLTIYPAWQGSTAGGLTYTLHRSGYGSRSAGFALSDAASNNFYYYAGGVLRQALTTTLGTVPAGTVQAIKIGPSGSPTGHFMSPQTATGAADVYANDVALFKSFLLYGAGNTIGWSVAGFPTSFTTAFGATDLPAANTSILDTDAEFVSFEYWGDQLLAICERSLYLIRPTGIVPEFDILKLPETTGPDKYTMNHPTGAIQISSRPTCTAKGQVYMVTSEGLVRFNGLNESVYSPVGPWPWTAPSANQNIFGLAFDGGLNAIAMWAPGTVGSDLFLLYSPTLDQWWSIDPVDFSGTKLMIAGGSLRQGALQSQLIRDPQLCFYNPTSDLFHRYDRNPAAETGSALAFTATGWLWATPIQYLSDIYGDWSTGGFAVRGRSRTGDAGPINLSWTLYGGSSPYAMQVRDSGTFDYSSGGTIDSRHLLGKTIDDAYIGIVISGLKWIELAGVDIYDSGTESRR